MTRTESMEHVGAELYHRLAELIAALRGTEVRQQQAMVPELIARIVDAVRALPKPAANNNRASELTEAC